MRLVRSLWNCERVMLAADPTRRGPAQSDFVGRRFGRLLVVGRLGRDRNRHSIWDCLCDCGWQLAVRQPSLVSGNTSSCGCLHREIVVETSTKHGHAANRALTSTYQSWAAMWARCRSKKGRRYRDYGARGIKVCRRWRSFANFLADMGPRPKHRTLDRRNNDKGYTPGNCRWATISEQNSNRRMRATN